MTGTGVIGVWTPEQVRAAEEPLLAATAQDALMRRAAHGVAQVVIAQLAGRTGGVAGRRVVVLAGAGNNGGDGLYAGVTLRRRGVAVVAVLLAPDRAHPRGLAALRAAHGRVLDAAADPDAAAAAVAGADLVVDAVVGISARGGLRPDAAALVDAADAAEVAVVAVDLPSGVDPVTGVVGEHAVRAVATAALGARKPVHVLAADACGDLTLVDIGLGDGLGEPALRVATAAGVGADWPVPGPGDDKYSQGVVGVAAGSATYPGAAVLASGAAVLATSGMVRYAGPAADAVRAAWPEVVATATVADAGRVQAWAVGPGLGTGEAGRETLGLVLDAGVGVLADADAVTLLAADRDLRTAAAAVPALITPHAGEFARLARLGDDRVDAARRAADDLGVTVLLKGNATVVAEPGGRVGVHPAGSSWLATAGSGDVLSGVAGALLAAGHDPWWAGCSAALVHARAAELAAHGATGPGEDPAPGSAGAPAPASRVQAALPAAIRAVRDAAGAP